MMMSASVAPMAAVWPSQSDTAGAMALLAVMADPARYKKMLDDIAKARDDAVKAASDAHAEFDAAQAKAGTENKAKEDDLAQLKASLDEREADLDALAQSLSKQEAELNQRMVQADEAQKAAAAAKAEYDSRLAKLRGVIGE